MSKAPVKATTAGHRPAVQNQPPADPMMLEPR
jgi:hypothetical protein